MASDRESASDLARLKHVQTRIRQLAAEHPWFAGRLRDAYEEYTRLHDRTFQRQMPDGTYREVEPPSPGRLELWNLEKFTEAERRTIAFYRLGGLADLGRLEPIVPRPAATGDVWEDTGRLVVWRARFPIRPEDREKSDPPIWEGPLPPNLAEEWLGWAEARVREHSQASPPEAGNGVNMKRPVPIAKAAQPAGKRPDVLLKMIRSRKYPIAGPKGAYVAELDHIIIAVPERKKAILDWADKNFPSQ